MEFPPSKLVKAHVLKSLLSYWPNNARSISALPIPTTNNYVPRLPLKLTPVLLPDWAETCGVNGRILIPSEIAEKSQNWQNIDWWTAAFVLLECWHERYFENDRKPIHSYSLQLKDWDSRVWQFAWVNRIGLFLRSWAHRIEPFEIIDPKVQFIITHDVDAIKKTTPIRIKQSLFGIFNSALLLKKGQYKSSVTKFLRSLRFAFRNDNWQTLDWLLKNHNQNGFSSIFNFYADTRLKSPRRWLFDPSYQCNSAYLLHIFSEIKKSKSEIGLHPTFDSWNNWQILAEQKRNLEKFSGTKVYSSRQHWLKFSFKDTWGALEKAGIKFDTTLMFNDRPGFRASFLGKWSPWDAANSRAHKLLTIPSILMDSHLYDYNNFDNVSRQSEIIKWLKENQTVGGSCCVLWHPHTLTDDYNWLDGYLYMIKCIHQIQDSVQRFKPLQ